MLAFMGIRLSDRQFGLFACACCRRIWHLFGDESMKRLIEVSERYLDGAASREEQVAAQEAIRFRLSVSHLALEQSYVEVATPLTHAVAAAGLLIADGGLLSQPEGAHRRAAIAAHCAAAAVREWVFQSLTWQGPEDFYEATLPAREAEALEKEEQCILLRDIAGNPFRPVVFDPNWRTPVAAGLARAIYEDRSFDHLPILADALMEAECDDAQILAHCRTPEPHAWGCWVLDLVRGVV